MYSLNKMLLLATLALLGFTYAQDPPQPATLTLTRGGDNNDTCVFTKSPNYPDYDCNKTIEIFTHGFWGSANDTNFWTMANSSMTYGRQSFYFVWESLGQNVLYAPLNADFCGACLAQHILQEIFIERNCATDTTKIHLVGHSFGAHLLGYTGFLLKPAVPVRSIRGMDPALFGFFIFNVSYALQPTDASERVICDHSNAWLLGDPTDRGTVNIVWNDGIFQPCCAWWDLVCSHTFIVGIVANAWYNIPNNFYGVNTQTGGSMISIDETLYDKGVYAVNTNCAPNYAKGNVTT